MGWNYDEHYAGRFLELSKQYIEWLVDFSWMAPWPFAAAESSGRGAFLEEAEEETGIQGLACDPALLQSAQAYDDLIRDYLAELLSGNGGEGVRTIVMHNAFEPFNPDRSLHFLDSAKWMIVDRDPRDNYVAGSWARSTRLPVDQFIN
jgi:hypothetical protein